MGLGLESPETWSYSCFFPSIFSNFRDVGQGGKPSPYGPHSICDPESFESFGSRCPFKVLGFNLAVQFCTEADAISQDHITCSR